MADGTEKTGTVESTLGRFIFNEILPQDLGFVDRSIPENDLVLEVDFHVGKKGLKQILEKVINIHGATKTAEVLDDIKAMGYKYSTRAAMTVSVSDMSVPGAKKQLIADAEKTITHSEAASIEFDPDMNAIYRTVSFNMEFCLCEEV